MEINRPYHVYNKHHVLLLRTVTRQRAIETAAKHEGAYVQFVKVKEIWPVGTKP